MAFCGGIGTGAAIRRPDPFTKMHLRFDNESQTLYDLTGENGAITVGSGVTQSAAASRFIGNGGAFDGLTGYLQFASKSNLDCLHQLGQDGYGSPQFSMSFWFKAAAWPATAVVFDNNNGTSTKTGISVYFNSTPRLYLKIHNGSGTAVVSAYRPLGYLDTDWHYYVLTYDQSLASGNGEIFVDGSSLGLIDKAAGVPATATATHKPTVGAFASAFASPLNGNLDEFIIRSGIIIDGTKVPTRRV